MSETTKDLVNEDGVLDEKAAGEAIDKVMAEANKKTFRSRSRC